MLTEHIEIESLRIENDWLRSENLRLMKLGYQCDITGLPNMRLFESTLERQWRRAIRYQQHMSILYVDLDRLKQINDKHGHAAGTTAIQTVADVLTLCAERPGDLSAHLHGDEFAVLLPNTKLEGAKIVAEAIVETVRERGLSVSIGVASLPASLERDHRMLLAMADAALYRAKESGRDRFEV